LPPDAKSWANRARRASFFKTKVVIFASPKRRRKTFALWKINVGLTQKNAAGPRGEKREAALGFAKGLLLNTLKHFGFCPTRP
jgi:hypothetical protein